MDYMSNKHAQISYNEQSLGYLLVHNLEAFPNRTDQWKKYRVMAKLNPLHQLCCTLEPSLTTVADMIHKDPNLLEMEAYFHQEDGISHRDGIYCYTRMSCSALWLACTWNEASIRSVGLVYLLLSAGASPLVTCKLIVTNERRSTEHHKSLLPFVVGLSGEGVPAITQLLTKYGSDVNEGLLVAAGRSTRHSSTLIKLFLRAGANVNGCPDTYSTPLQIAHNSDHIAAIQTLVFYGADRNLAHHEIRSINRFVEIALIFKPYIINIRGKKEVISLLQLSVHAVAIAISRSAEFLKRMTNIQIDILFGGF